MTSGIDRSKVHYKERSRNGYAMHPRYRCTQRPPSAAQIAYLKDLWRQLNENGVEGSYKPKALIIGGLAKAEIRRAHLEAQKHGIEFRREATAQ